VWNADGTDKTLVSVGFRFGSTVAKGGGSGISVTQQGVDMAGGRPYHPDGVIAQTWSIANGNAAYAANSWINTSDNPGQIVQFGQLISICIQYDSSGRLGSDSWTVSGLTGIAAGPYLSSGMSHYNNTAWTHLSITPNVILCFSDGTFGTIDGSIPVSNFGGPTYAPSSTPNEYALKFSVPFPAKMDGVWAFMAASGTGEFDVILYGGDDVLSTVFHDVDTLVNTSVGRFLFLSLGPIQLDAGVDYRVSVKPSAGNVTLYYYMVSSDAHRMASDAFGFGLDSSYSSRSGGGAWADITSSIPMIGVRISHFDAGGTPGEIDDVTAQQIIDDTAAAVGALLASHEATLAAAQPHYAPSKAGDAMALTPGERTTLATGIVSGVAPRFDDIDAAIAGLPTAPSTGDIATAVASGLDPRFDSIDSGLGAIGAPPTPGEIASEVDSTIAPRFAGLSTYAGGPVASVTAPVTVGANNDKAGYSLAPTGLDAILTTLVTLPTNFREWITLGIHRLCGRSEKEKVSDTEAIIRIFGSEPGTVVTQQTVTTTSTKIEIGPPEAPEG
jgi:hypothetical protein